MFSTGLSPRVRGSRRDGAGRAKAEGPIPAGAGEPSGRSSWGRRGRAYPRGCGGAPLSCQTSPSTWGLSPRVRGSPPTTVLAGERLGPIPAGAGEPWSRACASAAFRAYPRGCGGAMQGRIDDYYGMGLSPRVRGSPAAECRPWRDAGPIPAGAGEPRFGLTMTWDAGAYPRGCGGAGAQPISRRAFGGLSPRVRGSRWARSIAATGAGPIPAGAGEPITGAIVRPSPRAYPRGCGGAITTTSSSRSGSGLSPRVRGSPGPALAIFRCGGPIPAGAGEPRVLPTFFQHRRAYPRGCGGAAMMRSSTARLEGLSPRVRGSPGEGGYSLDRIGPIPAGAGEPPARRRGRCKSRAYPRGCGGAPSGLRVVLTGSGLSPRVRGSRPRRADRGPPAGPIPAGAGEP